MSDRVVRRTVTVRNAQGIHARPADLLAKTASQFDATIWIEREGERIDAKSILSLLTLAAVEGTRLEICAEGTDAEEAVATMAELIESGFDEAGTDSSSPTDSSPPQHRPGSVR